MVSMESIRLKITKIPRLKLALIRRKQLTNLNFTIISNNCWGGMIYESYGLKKLSPTVGMYFMAEDYIKFVSNLREYISSPLSFIQPEESKWRKQNPGGMNTPIGKLKDIELFFLHYSSEEQALAKWTRRCARINWDNLIVKFNDQNGCTLDDVHNFLQLRYDKKVFFTVNDWQVVDSSNTVIKINQHLRSKEICTSYEPFGRNRSFDVTQFLNR